MAIKKVRHLNIIRGFFAFLLSYPFLAGADLSSYAHIGSIHFKLKGTIPAPKCDIAFDNGGVFDFGEIERPPSVNGLYSKTKIAINCTAKVPLSFSFIDNRKDSAPLDKGPVAFGLGKTDSLDNIGYYTINVEALTDVDGSFVFLMNDSKQLHSAPVLEGHSYFYSTDIANPNSVESKNLETYLKVTIFIDEQLFKKAEHSGHINLDGNATYQLIIGL